MMRKVLTRIQRSLPLGLTAHEVAQALLDALPGADAQGFAIDEMAWRLRNDVGALGVMTTELLASAATAERHAPHLLTTLLGGIPAAHYISLGTHCFTASFLRRWGLRTASGPFDWLFSSVPMITHILDDDFKVFLDRGQYEPVPEHDRKDGPLANRVHHRFYREAFGVQHVFNHHDAHLDPAYAHFVRCVERFRQSMKSTDPKVLVLARTECEGSGADLLVLRDALLRYGTDIKLLAIDVPPVEPDALAWPRLEQRAMEPALCHFAFNPSSRWDPLRFADLVDEHVLMQQLLKQAAALGAAVQRIKGAAQRPVTEGTHGPD
jgi:hypothetical protein